MTGRRKNAATDSSPGHELPLPLLDSPTSEGDTRNSQAADERESAPDPVVLPPIAVAPTPTEGLGWLRQVRMDKNISLDQAERDLHIRRQYLEAIEENHLSTLPSGVVLGFVRSYARYLGLDEDEAVGRCRQQGRAFLRVRLQMRQPMPDVQTPSAGLLTLAAFTALALYAGWFFFASEDRALVSRPPELPSSPPIALQSAAPETAPPGMAPVSPSVVVMPSAPPEATGTTAAAVPAPVPDAAVSAIPEDSADSAPLPPDIEEVSIGRIQLYAVQRTWLRVIGPNGRTIEEVTLNEGDSYEPPASSGVTMDVGNAGGVAMQVDGRDMPSLGGIGQAVRGLSLDAIRARAKGEVKPR
ncbi:MAG: DUF4115 domain-containing protein [Alphaproteobacteria bacterium]|nr:MAG: DUF4115 domain-containing protein [Alphaproteobacteria bacterium]